MKNSKLFFLIISTLPHLVGANPHLILSKLQSLIYEKEDALKHNKPYQELQTISDRFNILLQQLNNNLMAYNNLSPLTMMLITSQRDALIEQFSGNSKQHIIIQNADTNSDNDQSLTDCDSLTNTDCESILTEDDTPTDVEEDYDTSTEDDTPTNDDSYITEDDMFIDDTFYD